jgi:hypothetical protein
MRAKMLHPLTQVLAIQCVLWIAVAAVLPQIHQALAGHRHAFCVEHHRVEDQAETETPGGLVQPSDVQLESRVSDISTQTSRGRNGVECLSSNFSAYLVFRAHPRVATPVSLRLPSVRLFRDVTTRITDTLRIAPKNSPPIG